MYYEPDERGCVRTWNNRRTAIILTAVERIMTLFPLWRMRKESLFAFALLEWVQGAWSAVDFVGLLEISQETGEVSKISARGAYLSQWIRKRCLHFTYTGMICMHAHSMYGYCSLSVLCSCARSSVCYDVSSFMNIFFWICWLMNAC